MTMTDQQTIQPTVPQTVPTDTENTNSRTLTEPIAPPVDQAGMIAMPTPVDAPVVKDRPRARRIRATRLLGHGEGDYCIYAIADGTTGIPLGALVPIPGVPRFPDNRTAKRWIVSSSGDLLTDTQVMIFKAHEIINVSTRARISVEITAKSKIREEKPATQEMP